MKLTSGKKPILFKAEDVSPITDGAQIVVIPGDFSAPENWASDKPNKRRYEIQINVETNSFKTGLEVSDKIEKLLFEQGILRVGDAFSDAIDYLVVVTRRYRYFNLEEFS